MSGPYDEEYGRIYFVGENTDYRPGKSRLFFYDDKSYNAYLRKSKKLYPEYYTKAPKKIGNDKKLIEDMERDAEKREEDINKLKSYLDYSPSYVMCDLNAIFSDIIMLKKSTSSPSVQFLAKIKPESAKPLLEYYKKEGRDVFIKLYSQKKSNRIRFQIEVALYQYLNRFILGNNIPNLIKYIMSFSCKNIENIFDDLGDSLHSRLNKDNAVNYMVLERSRGVSLQDMYGKKRLKQYFPSIFFQIMYTLSELNYQNIRHNDCHGGNWLLEDMGEEKNLFYFISGDTYFKITTRYWVKLYDFDLSTSTDDKFKNIDLEDSHCEDYGVCSTPNDKFDMFIILSQLIHEGKILKDKNKGICSYFSTILEKIVLNKKLYDPKYCCKGFAHRLCITKKENCRDGKVPSDKDLLPPNKVLLLPEIESKGQVEKFKGINSWKKQWGYPLQEKGTLDMIPSNVIDMKFYVSSSVKSKNPTVYIANKLLE